jgi:predicted RNA-binding Zn-ribbon protein involved in translation (DUF1610 family)
MVKRKTTKKKARLFWCSHGHKMVSAKTTLRSPKCPICGSVMTYGTSNARRVRAKK